MTAACLVGGCGWHASAPYRGTLELAVEAHRLHAHDWVAPGKLHRLSLEPHEAALVERALQARP